MSTSSVAQSTASLAVPADDAACLHDVQLYSDDAYLLDSLTTFVGREIAQGNSAIVIATKEHRDGLAEREIPGEREKRPEHAEMQAHAGRAQNALDVSLGVLPLFHIFGLNVLLGRSLKAGAPILLLDRFEAGIAIDLIERHRGRQRKEGQSVRVSDPSGLGRHATEDGRPGHPLPGERLEQAGEREPRVDGGQHLGVDQQQFPAAKRCEGRRPGTERGTPDDLAAAAKDTKAALAILGGAG